MSFDSPQKGNICAIVVTYNPDEQFNCRIIQIARQVAEIVIIDNRSNNLTLEILRDLSCRLDVQLILNDNNRGIASALNQGALWAHKQGYKWALMLDQDTCPLHKMVETLCDVYDEYPQKDKLAVIGCNYFDPVTRQVKFHFKNDGTYLWTEQKTVITSGSLIPLEIFNHIGQFREDFFIDHVDDEYCLRARSKGFKTIIAQTPIMAHSLGAPSMHKLLWLSKGTSNHSARRRYYMTRNHLILVKEYLFAEPFWAITTIYSRIKSFILMLFFENQKLQKLKFFGLGLVDGVISNFNRKLN